MGTGAEGGELARSQTEFIWKDIKETAGTLVLFVGFITIKIEIFHIMISAKHMCFQWDLLTQSFSVF